MLPDKKTVREYWLIPGGTCFGKSLVLCSIAGWEKWDGRYLKVCSAKSDRGDCVFRILMKFSYFCTKVAKFFIWNII